MTLQHDIKRHPTVTVNINDLTFDSANPNVMSQQEEAGLRKSFHTFGDVSPIVIDQNNFIVHGNHRAAVLKELGATEINAVRKEFSSDVERIECAQTLNKLHGEYDKQLDSAQLLQVLNAGRLDNLAELIAKGREELENTLTKYQGIHFQHEDDFNVDKALEDLVPETQLGDIWQLGEHRIICADNSDNRSLEKIFLASKYDLVVTSPPYDDLREYGGYEFDFEKTSQMLYDYCSDGGVIVWVIGDAVVDGSETGSSFKQALHFKDIGFKIHDTMIYYKGSFRYPDGQRYYQAFEYMFVLTKGKLKTFNAIADRENIHYGETRQISDRAPDGSLSKHKIQFDKQYGIRHNVWTIRAGFMKSAEDKDAFKHPAIFPQELAIDHIRSWSNEGDLIFDPFLGSGSTLIACEQTDRVCYGVEIDPRYTDICVKRWEAYTHRKATKLGGGG